VMDLKACRTVELGAPVITIPRNWNDTLRAKVSPRCSRRKILRLVVLMIKRRAEQVALGPWIR